MENANSSSDDYGCRFNRPAAVIHKTTKYPHDLQKLVEEDSETAALYIAMLEEILEDGMALNQNKESARQLGDGPIYRAPIGERAIRKVERNWPFVPWCGELVIEGGDAARGIREVDWRSYFFDLRVRGLPLVEIDDVLLSSIESKKRARRSKIGGRGQSRQQDRHIVDSMDKAFYWCRKVQPRFELRRIFAGR